MKLRLLQSAGTDGMVGHLAGSRLLARGLGCAGKSKVQSASDKVQSLSDNVEFVPVQVAILAGPQAVLAIWQSLLGRLGLVQIGSSVGTWLMLSR